MALVTPLALTLLSGCFYGLSFPTARLQLLAWVALVPFLAAIRRASLGSALFLAWVWTTSAAYTVGDWFPRSVATYYDQPLVVGIAFFFGVSSLMAAPYYMAFAASYRALAHRPAATLPLLAGAAWVAAELGRVKLLTGNPWALLGYSQVGVDRLVQIADVTGVYGVSFVLAAVNAALVEVWFGGPRAWRRTITGAAVAGTAVTFVLGYGHARLMNAPAAPPGARQVKVAMIQANLDLGSQWRPEFYGRNLDAYLRLTYQALQESRPEIVFWPENALSFFLEDEPLYRRAIARVIGSSGAELIVGGPRFVGSPSDPVYHNSVFLLSPDGSILARYDKQRLVPFAEYFPLSALGSLQRRFARVRELAPGDPAPPLPTAAGPAGITICNEAMFPEIAAARVREGATFFVDPANDTWLTAKFSAQQFDIVTLRTVEQRRYLVRASTSGPSAIVDPFGRVTVRTDFFTAAAIAGTIEPRTAITLYCRIGDLFAYACTLAALVGWLSRSGFLRRSLVRQ